MGLMGCIRTVVFTSLIKRRGRLTRRQTVDVLDFSAVPGLALGPRRRREAVVALCFVIARRRLGLGKWQKSKCCAVRRNREVGASGKAPVGVFEVWHCHRNDSPVRVPVSGV